MRKLLIVAALAAICAAEATSASVIPPFAKTVVTHCGVPTTVFVTTKTGFVRYEGAEAARLAKTVPFNLRVESGCSR